MEAWKADRIVVPVDFSADTSRAIATAVQIAGDPARVHLVHVLYPLDVVSPGAVWGTVTNEKREKAVREGIDRALAEAGVSGTHTEVRFGDPGLEVADFAAEVAADLIVIPSHGYHGVKRLVLGSVTERVLRHARCDVLVLRRSDAG